MLYSGEEGRNAVYQPKWTFILTMVCIRKFQKGILELTQDADKAFAFSFDDIVNAEVVSVG